MPPAFIPHFCHLIQLEILFARHPDGSYSKFRFDCGEFRRFRCSDCRLTPTERDLFVLETGWSGRIERQVIVTRNVLSGALEQYIYDDAGGRFAQTSIPRRELTGIVSFRSGNRRSEQLFTAGGVDNVPVTLISRGADGRLKRERYDEETQRFRELEPKKVKVLGEETSPELQNLTTRIQMTGGDTLNQWLAQCEPGNRRRAEAERDRELESLLRCRAKEYATASSKLQNPPARAIDSDSSSEYGVEDVAEPPVYDYVNDDEIYGEFTRSDASESETIILKRKLEPIDISTIVIEEDVVYGSERTV